VTLPPHSPPRETLPSLGNIFHRQTGVAGGARQSKRTRTKTGLLTRSSTGSPLQPRLVLVSPDSRGTSVVPALMETTHLFRVLQVPSSSPTNGVATDMTAEPSSSSHMGAEPRPKKAHLWSFLWVSYWYVCEVVCCLCSSRFSCFYPLTQNVIFRCHESYPKSSDHPSVCYTLEDASAHITGSAASSRAPGNTGARGISAGGTDAAGVIGAGSASTAWEWCYLIRDELTQVELSTDGASLGIVNIEVDGQTPGQVMMPRVRSVTWWCVVPVLVRPGALPQVRRSLPLGPQVPWARG
jgi:hypothetical protein